MRIALILLLAVPSYGFYVKNRNETSEIKLPALDRPIAEKLRSKANSIELFGQRMEVPAWMNEAAEKTRRLFDSATHLFGKGTATSRKSSDDLMTNLKKDETTRIWFAVYLNILIVVLIYVFVTIKLALLSLSEGQMERKKKNTFSSHVAFDSPDYNVPLTKISTRNARQNAPMTIDPMTDFEMAREARENEVLQNVTPLDFDVLPSTEHDNSL